MTSVAGAATAGFAAPTPSRLPGWRIAVNLLAYQTGWAATVLGAAHGRPWLGAGIGLALALAQVPLMRPPHGTPRRELALLLEVGMLGAALDSAQAALGVFRLTDQGWGVAAPLWLCPPWLAALWLVLASTFNVSLRSLQTRPLLAALLGAVGGPLAYGAGARLGAVELGWPVPLAMAELALVWAVATPLLLSLARRLSGQSPALQG